MMSDSLIQSESFTAMFGGCDEACAIIQNKLEQSAKRVDNLQEQVKEAEARSVEIRQRMQNQLTAMESAKSAHINDLKEEQAKNRAAKAEVDARINTLQDQIIELGREHSKNLLDSQRLMAEMVEKKDVATQNMLRMVMDQFTIMMDTANKRNSEQFNRMMDHMKLQDTRIGEILNRRDRRIEMLDRARAEQEQTLVPSTTALPVETRRTPQLSAQLYSGAELYRMVQDRQEELTSRGKRSIGDNGQFQKTVPLIRAAFYAIDAIAGRSGLAIGSH